MGFWDKFRNPSDDEDEIYEDEYGYEGFGEDEQPQQPPKQQSGYNAPAQRQSAGMGMGSGSLEMKVVKPDKYDSATAQKIADHLLNDRTVVLNLEATNKESARRLIDFLSGVAYSIDGYIQRVANNTFVIVPKNVDVSGDQLKGAQQQQQDDGDLF